MVLQNKGWVVSSIQEISLASHCDNTQPYDSILHAGSTASWNAMFQRTALSLKYM